VSHRHQDAVFDRRLCPALIASKIDLPPKEGDMGKYVIAWLLGVPAFVLVIIYLFVH
jgi:hypothetical protein